MLSVRGENELGHLLMPKDKREGHYGQRANISVPGAHHVRGISLLGEAPLGDQEHAQHTKRIWDLGDSGRQDQLHGLFSSIYLR